MNLIITNENRGLANSVINEFAKLEIMKITIVPFGGLGNRMRVLNSALYLNERLGGSKLQLVWLVKAELNAPFDKLFLSASIVFNLIRGIRYALFLKFFKHIFIVKYPKVYRTFMSIFYDLILFDDDIKKLRENGDFEILKKTEKVLIATCFEFYPFPSFDNFILSNEILKKFEKLNLPEDAIGVHIRRTDFVEIIAESGIAEYEKKMNELPHSVFYLATDDYKVKEYFANEYANRIITQNAELSRKSLNGIQEALVDILALSKCKSIICNKKSSFANTALRLGRKKGLIEV